MFSIHICILCLMVITISSLLCVLYCQKTDKRHLENRQVFSKCLIKTIENPLRGLSLDLCSQKTLKCSLSTLTRVKCFWETNICFWWTLMALIKWLWYATTVLNFLWVISNWIKKNKDLCFQIVLTCFSKTLICSWKTK